jgi:hypothetical protein
MSYCFQDIKGQNGANTQNLEFFISCPVLLVLAHLSQRVLSTHGVIVIVCKRYILIFFSEMTGPIRNKFRQTMTMIPGVDKILWLRRAKASKTGHEIQNSKFWVLAPFWPLLSWKQ